jgi:hypothetical protein
LLPLPPLLLHALLSALSLLRLPSSQFFIHPTLDLYEIIRIFKCEEWDSIF